MLAAQVTDWTNVLSSNTITVFTQSELLWLDLLGFQDVVAWLEVKELTTGSGAPTISYQTAPSKDDLSFSNITTAVTLSVGLTTTKMLKDSTTLPLARWFRWQLGSGSATGTWGVTFRLWIAANRMSHKGS